MKGSLINDNQKLMKGRLCYSVLSPFMTYRWVCKQINTTGPTNVAGTAYPSEFNPGVQWGSFYLIIIFMCMFQIVVCHFVLFLLAIVITPLIFYVFYTVENSICTHTTAFTGIKNSPGTLFISGRIKKYASRKQSTNIDVSKIK